MGKRIWWLGVALVVAAMVAGVTWLLAPSPFASSPMPDPNGYDDLVVAAGMIEGNVPAPSAYEGETSGAVDDKTLEAVVTSNAQSLARARIGLARESRVRLPATGAAAGSRDHAHARAPRPRQAIRLRSHGS